MSLQKLTSEVNPFRGIRYNPEKVELEKSVAPPYDVISPKEKDQYCLYPYNICHLILPGTEYQKAGRLFQEWLEKKYLIQDSALSFYFYTQEYLDNGISRKRLGCMGLLRLQETDSGVVLPHEHTLDKPKGDRLSLLRSVQANLSPIFGIVEDQDSLFFNTIKDYISQHPALFRVSLQAVVHELWQVTQLEVMEAVQQALSDEKILIADGHHRYESALAYRSERRRERTGYRESNIIAAYDFVMVHFVSAKDEGLTIWPIHRVLQGGRAAQTEGIIRELSQYFEIHNLPSYQLFSELKKSRENPQVHGSSFGLYLKGRKSFLLTLQNSSATESALKAIPEPMRRLDVSALHTIVLKQILDHPIDEEHIYFTPSAERAFECVEQEGYEMAFLLNPTPIEQVYSIASTGARLPQKSTYFYPKLLSGLVINKL